MAYVGFKHLIVMLEVPIIPSEVFVFDSNIMGKSLEQ